MLGRMLELLAWGACKGAGLPVLRDGRQDVAVVLSHSSVQPWPSGWLSGSSSTLLCGSGTIPTERGEMAGNIHMQ